MSRPGTSQASCIVPGVCVSSTVLCYYASLVIMFTCSYCEEGLQEAVCTLIWAAPRLSADIKELDEVSTTVYVLGDVPVYISILMIPLPY